MPKEVAPPYDFMTPPAANLEDMTQPMGPLEEGDQALVDAAHKLPAGEHIAEHDDGTRTRVLKDEGFAREQVVTDTTLPDGTIEGASTLIDSAPGVEGINANISEWPAGERGGHTVHNVMGNDVGNVPGPREANREEAQAIKLETAREIDSARERLETARVQDPGLAREMADAEKPHRDKVAERDSEAAAADAAAEKAAKQFGEGAEGIGDADVLKKSQQAARLGGAARRANEISLSHADAAAEQVREQHETREAA